ncbi:leucine-rich repeat protein [Culicoidibacter larvae]|uniref:LPXTG cell wall anchor domain-containing protein n=1 Tax=Culicoidibacter larvae TaxID=2579976 RepID=A0A5R8Q7G6_9FIRM|nr:leucine-rich repeat protein [Culicoidibacter larvae]TLG70285.1 LPXTG cell wall anchor domain-containing protein [Culicoidibacter larvae]
MKKKILTLIFILTLLAGNGYTQTVFASEAKQEPANEQTVENNLRVLVTVIIGDIEYKLDDTTNTAKITDYVGVAKDVVIPNKVTYNSVDYNVTVIGEYAFEQTQLLSVVIPNSIVSIEESAFDSNQLTSVEIPNSVTTIGEYAFATNKLTNVEIPNSITAIGDNAFARNQLTSIEIPDSVAFIGDMAFKENQLASVEIPDSVTFIGDMAFKNNELTSVKISNSVNTIKYGAFSFNNLTSVDIPNGVTSIDSYSFAYNGLTSVDIPEGVTSIGANAFSYNQLTGISLPSSLTYIGSYAFESNQLTSVEIPDSVTRLGNDSFKNNKLTNVNISNNITAILNETFYDNDLTSVEIPEGVTKIHDFAFQINPISSVTLPSSLTYIGSYNFDGPLETIFIPMLTDLPNMINILSQPSVMNLTTTNYTSMYALDNIQGDYVDGTLSQYSLDYGQTQELAVGQIYNPEVKRYDKPSNTWVDPQDNPIDIPNFTVEWFNENGDVVGTGTTFTASETGTYHAVVNGVLRLTDINVSIKSQEHLVAFDAKGGSPVPASQNVVEGEKATEPTAPTKENAEFQGWYTDETYITQWDFNTPVTSSMTLYAKWQANETEIPTEPVTPPAEGTLPQTGDATSLMGLGVMLVGSSILGIFLLKKRKI